VTEAWDDEGFGGENDWGEESVETDLEEEGAPEAGELEDDAEAWEGELEGEQ